MTIEYSSHFRNFLIVTIIWAAGIIFAAALDWYLLALIQEKADQFVELKKSVVTLEFKRTSLVKARKHMEELKPALEELTSAFVNTDEPLDFIESLESLAKTDGVTIKLGLPSKKDHVLIMKLEVLGPVANVLAFAGDIESMPGQIIFEDVTFEMLTEAAPAETGKRPASAKEQARLVGSITALAK